MAIFKHAFLLFLALYLCPTASLQAQCTFIGKVKDSETGKPLEGATISFDFKKTGVASDSNGVFTIYSTCEEHTVNVRYVGYKPYSWRFTLKGTMNLDIEMINISNQLAEVIVSGQGSVRTVETPSLGVNLLSLKSVSKLPPAAGELDIFRGIQMLPGVSSVGEGSNGVNIRGGNIDQNWIFIDNMPVFNPTHLLGLFSIFPTDALREVQLYKGSIPARFGGRTSSVMDVKMIEPSTDKFKLKGGIGMISNRLNAEIPIIKDKLSILLSARLSYNEYLIKFYNSVFVKAGVARKAIPNNHANFYDLANKILYKPNEKNTFTFSTYLSHDKYEADSLFSISEGLYDHTIFSYAHQNFALRWNRYFNPSLNFNMTAVTTKYTNTTSVPAGPAPLDLTTQLHYQSVKAELTYLPTAKHKINTGINIIRYGLNPADLEPRTTSIISPIHLQPEQAYESAIYASDEYELSPKWLVELGIRGVYYRNIGPYKQAIYTEGVEKTPLSISSILDLKSGEVEQSYFKPEPRLAVRYKLNDISSVKMGYNRMNQFLHLISNSTTPLPNARWKTANRYIPPQQSDLITIGYFRDNPKSMWEYSVETYIKQQKHIFDYVAGADLQINPNIETQVLNGEGRAYGAELLLTKKRGVMTGWLSYTYSRSLQHITGDVPETQQLNKGEWFPSNIDKPHNLNLLMNFQKDKFYSLSFTFVYSTGRPFTAPVGSYKTLDQTLPIFTNRNNSRISDYHRLDFSWTIFPAVKDRRWISSWVFAIYNVYGHKNAYSYFYKKNSIGLTPYKLSVFTAPLVSLTYNFTFE